MSEKDQHIYHCDRCNAVFSGAIPLPKGTVCSECGELPFRPMDFNSTEHLPKVVDSDRSHGVPGQDVADFVSMQKVRRRQQGRWALILWITLLVVGIGVTAYNQMAEDEVVAGKSALEIEQEQYQEKLELASEQASRRYDEFLRSKDATSRSAHVLGGVSQILKMQEHEESVEAMKVQPPLAIVKRFYSDEGGRQRLELLAQDSMNHVFELVFWKVDDKWLLDWQQHVRFSEKSWSAFLEIKPMDVSEEFCLYVRRRHVQSSNGDDALQLLFYQPKIYPGKRSGESPQVELASDSPMHAQLQKAFEALAESDGEARTVGCLDKTGWLRVRANLSWHMDEGYDKVLVLDSVKALNWMAQE